VDRFFRALFMWIVGSGVIPFVGHSFVGHSLVHTLAWESFVARVIRWVIFVGSFFGFRSWESFVGLFFRWLYVGVFALSVVIVGSFCGLFVSRDSK
jgi:hypothetical protein